MREIGRTVDAVLHATETERAVPAGSLDVAVELPDGRRLVGTVAGVRGDAVLDVTYSTLAAKHRLAAWVKLLALVAHTGSAAWRAVAVGRSRDGVERCLLGGVEPERAVELLTSLVALRDAGLRAPLPMAVGTSSAYAQGRRRRMTESSALSFAERSWKGGFAPENKEREHVLVFGEAAALATLAEARPEPGEEYPGETTRFGVLARRLWDPITESQIAVRP
jgi:exodeoxyribonuclease V gamma subunit